MSTPVLARTWAPSTIGIQAKDAHRPTRRREHAVEQADGGGLPRAVVAKETEDLPALDFHGQLVDGYRCAKVAGELLGADDDWHRGSRPF